MTDMLSTNGVLAAEDLFYLLGGDAPVKVLDATYHSPDGQSPYQAFLGRRIEDAQFFDIDAVADQTAPLPHTLPSPEYFAQCVSAMGIGNEDHIVIYDQSGAYMASSRAWWMFRVFGHEKVYVLEGGLAAWVSNGFPVKAGPADAPDEGRFTALFQPGFAVSKDDILGNIDTHEMTVVDARPASRFSGAAPEPRPGMRAGHIPNSRNLPFGAVLQPAGTFKSDDELKDMFIRQGIDGNGRIAVSCGSGVTACTVALALFKSTGLNAAVYDGSWTEWGDETSDMPVEVSA